jgi:hypothetical protein
MNFLLVEILVIYTPPITCSLPFCFGMLATCWPPTSGEEPLQTTTDHTQRAKNVAVLRDWCRTQLEGSCVWQEEVSVCPVTGRADFK